MKENIDKTYYKWCKQFHPKVKREIKKYPPLKEKEIMIIWKEYPEDIKNFDFLLGNQDMCRLSFDDDIEFTKLELELCNYILYGWIEDSRIKDSILIDTALLEETNIEEHYDNHSYIFTREELDKILKDQGEYL